MDIEYETEAPSENAGNGWHGGDDKPTISIITGAPDIKDFIKPKRTPTQREYEERTASVLKALLLGTLNSDNPHDAAAIIRFGPAFARGTGHLADADEHARKVIHAVTTPGNPYIAFASAAFPLIGQLIRNHEAQIQEIPQKRRDAKAARKQRKATGAPKPEPRVRVRIPFTRWSIPIRFNVNWSAMLSGFKAQTVHPDTLAESVFGDPKIIKSLMDLGVTIMVQDEGPPPQ